MFYWLLFCRNWQLLSIMVCVWWCLSRGGIEERKKKTDACGWCAAAKRHAEASLSLSLLTTATITAFHTALWLSDEDVALARQQWWTSVCSGERVGAAGVPALRSSTSSIILVWWCKNHAGFHLSNFQRLSAAAVWCWLSHYYTYIYL